MERIERFVGARGGFHAELELAGFLHDFCQEGIVGGEGGFGDF